jgi:outer membrane protein assembly factor BamB
MKRLALSSLVLGLLFVLSVQGDEPAQWSQFRGPNGCGVSQEEKRLPIHFGPSKNVVWKTALPPGHASPCVWGNHIFLTGFEQSERKLETLCLDRQSGKILWRRGAPAREIEKGHPVSSPASPTPAADGERIYVYFGSYGLLCYDFDGKLLWEDKRIVTRAKFGTGTSPMMVGDLVITNDQDEGLPLRAVHRKTGKPVWKDQELGIGHAMPIVWRHDRDVEIIVPSKNQLTSFNLDGTRRWWLGDLPSDAYATPVVGDGLLFVNFTSPGGEVADRPLEPFETALEKYDTDKDRLLSREELPKGLVFIDRGVKPGTPGGSLTIDMLFETKLKDRKINKDVWDRLRTPGPSAQSSLWAIRPGAKGELPVANKVWRHTKGLPEVPSPLYYRGYVYLFRRGGIATCLEARTGKEAYQERLPASGSYYSSPVAGDGKIYIAAESGSLIVLEAGKSMKVLARNDLGERIMATPAITDGTLYVRTEKYLYAFRD